MTAKHKALGRVCMTVAAAVVAGAVALPAAAVPYEVDWAVSIGDQSSRGVRTIDMAVGPDDEPS